jgi:hypothetical protein
MLGRVHVESSLNFVAFLRRRWPVEDFDASVDVIAAREGSFKLLNKVTLGVVVFGEDQNAGVVPLRP